MRDTGDRLRVELSFLRDNTIAAVRERRLGVLKDALGTYEALVESFLELLADMQTRYTRQLALKEVHGIGTEWSEVRWIESDFKDILDAALATEDQSVIDDLMFFPLRLARIAIRHRDYYIFYRFLTWIPYTYYKSRTIQDAATRGYVVDRCGRYLAEYVSFVLSPLLTDPASDFEPRHVADYMVGFLRTFSDLMRQALERAETDDFCEFARQLSSATDSTSLSLRYEDVSPTRRESWLEILRLEQILFLGQLAWMIHLFEIDRISADGWRSAFPCVALPEDPNEVWSRFLEARRQGDEDTFNWRWWELDEMPEGRAHFLAFDNYLSKAAVIGTLVRMGPNQNLVLPPSSEAESLGRDDSDVQQFLASLEASTPWVELVGGDVSQRAASLSASLKAAASEAIRDEGMRIVAAPLSESRIDAVASNLEEAWIAGAHGRHVAEQCGVVVWPQDSPEELELFGLNNWDLKVLYIEDTGTWVTHGWGDEYGRSIAVGETERLVEALRDVATERPSDNLVDQVAKLVRTSQESSRSPVVIVVDAWEAVLGLSDDARFSPTADPFSHGRIGDLLGAPVYRVFAHAADGVFVGDISQAVEWRQYPPPLADSPADSERLIAATLRARWRVLGEDEALQLVRDNPAWRTQDGADLSVEDAALTVQQRVLVSVREKFEIVPRDGASLVFFGSPD